MEQGRVRGGILKEARGEVGSPGGLGTTTMLFGGTAAMGAHNAAEARNSFRLSDTAFKGTIGLREAETAMLQMHLEVSPAEVQSMYLGRTRASPQDEPEIDLDTFCDMVMELKVSKKGAPVAGHSSQALSLSTLSPSKAIGLGANNSPNKASSAHKGECSSLNESVRKLFGEVMSLDAPLEMRRIIEPIRALPLRNRSFVSYKCYCGVQEEDLKISSPQKKGTAGKVAPVEASNTPSKAASVAYSGDGGKIEFDPIRGWLRGIELTVGSEDVSPRKAGGGGVQFKSSTIFNERGDGKGAEEGETLRDVMRRLWNGCEHGIQVAHNIEGGDAPIFSHYEIPDSVPGQMKLEQWIRMLQDMRLVPLPHQLHPRSDAEPLPSFPLSAEAAATIFEFTLERQELLVTCENAEVGQQVIIAKAHADKVKNANIRSSIGVLTRRDGDDGWYANFPESGELPFMTGPPREAKLGRRKSQVSLSRARSTRSMRSASGGGGESPSELAFHRVDGSGSPPPKGVAIPPWPTTMLKGVWRQGLALLARYIAASMHLSLYQVEEQVLGAMQRLVRLVHDPMVAEIRSAGVQEVIDDYSWRLKILFVHFARGLMPESEGMLDVSGVLLPLPDFIQLARVFGIAPQRMGVKAVTRCFASSRLGMHGDEKSSLMSYEEFIEAMCRISILLFGVPTLTSVSKVFSGQAPALEAKNLVNRPHVLSFLGQHLPPAPMRVTRSGFLRPGGVSLTGSLGAETGASTAWGSPSLTSPPLNGGLVEGEGGDHYMEDALFQPWEPPPGTATVFPPPMVRLNTDYNNGSPGRDAIRKSQPPSQMTTRWSPTYKGGHHGSSNHSSPRRGNMRGTRNLGTGNTSGSVIKFFDEVDQVSSPGKVDVDRLYHTSVSPVKVRKAVAGRRSLG